MKITRPLAALAVALSLGAGAAGAAPQEEHDPCEARERVEPTVEQQIKYHKVRQTQKGWTTDHPNYAVSDWIERPEDGQVPGLTSSGTYTLDIPFKIGGSTYKYTIKAERDHETDPGDPGNIPGPECTPCDWPQIKTTSESCGTVDIDAACGAISGSTTFLVTNQPWSYGVWFSTSAPVNPADGTVGGLSLAEDEHGGSVTVYYWVAGTENDALDSQPLPRWNAPAQIQVVTDCEPPVTDPPVETSEPPVVTEPPTTDPPSTDPVVSDPPATDPPASDPTATDPPATDPVSTDPVSTEPPVETSEPPSASTPVDLKGAAGTTSAPSSTQPTATLAETGSDTAGNLAPIALLLLCVGGVMTWVAVRRPSPQ